MLKFSPKAAVFQSVVFKRKSSHQALPYKRTGTLAFLPTYYLPSEVKHRTQAPPQKEAVSRYYLESREQQQPSPETSTLILDLSVSEHEETTSYLH